MPVYDIIRVTRCRERHSVEAASPVEAMRAYLKGDATLKDDEVLDGGDETVIERETDKDVTDEALVIYEMEDCP